MKRTALMGAIVLSALGAVTPSSHAQWSYACPECGLTFQGTFSTTEKQYTRGNLLKTMTWLPTYWMSDSNIAPQIKVLDATEWSTDPVVAAACNDRDGPCARRGAFVHYSNGTPDHIYVAVANLESHPWEWLHALGHWYYKKALTPAEQVALAKDFDDLQREHFGGYGSGSNGCMNAWSCGHHSTDIYEWIGMPIKQVSDGETTDQRLIDKLKNSSNPGWQAKYDALKSYGLVSLHWNRTITGIVAGTAPN